MNQSISDGLDLAAERTRLVEKLGRLWAWLENHPGHKDYDRRERVWLSTLNKYEIVCSQLKLIEHGLGTA